MALQRNQTNLTIEQKRTALAGLGLDQRIDFDTNGSLIIKKIIVPTPAGFVVPELLGNFEVYNDNGVFSCNVTPDSLIDTTEWTNTYYVDNVGGNNANDGLTWVTRKKHIGSAFRDASASGLPSRILVWAASGLPYYRQVSAADDGAHRESNVPILLEAMNGRVKTGPFDNLVWSKSNGLNHTYQVARSNSTRAFNPSIKDKNGIYAEYVWASSAAEVDTVEGSWFTDDVTVWIHPHFKAQPNIFNARVMLKGANAFSWSCNHNLKVRGFDFEGGIGGAIKIANGSTNTVVLDDCTFRYSANANNFTGSTAVVDGVQITGVGLVAAFNCSADKNAKDGFNLHSQESVIPTGLFVNCSGHLNGVFPSVSNNGFTTHDSVRSISLNSNWTGNYGTGSAHVNDNTQVWSLGDISGATMSDVFNGGTINFGAFGVWSGAAEMWLDNCKDIGVEIGLYQSDTSSLNVKNYSGSGRRVGTINTY